MDFLRDSGRGHNLDDFQNSSKLVIKFSDELVMNSDLVVPSGGLGLVIIISVIEVIISLGSEVGGLINLVVGLLEFSGVNGDSLVGLFEGGLADSHEVDMSGNLVFLILMSVSEGLLALSKDVLEHAENSLDRGLVRKVLSEGKHNLDHLGPLGSMLEMFEELFDVVLSFGNLYE